MLTVLAWTTTPEAVSNTYTEIGITLKFVMIEEGNWDMGLHTLSIN